MDWVDEKEKAMNEEKSKEYFNMQEGDNKFLLLSHCAPLFQRWTGSKYETVDGNDEGVSVKGMCWVYQDGMIKSAKLPYTAVKLIRTYQNDSEWDLGDFPWTNMINIIAKGAGTKEVEYSLTISPKKTEIPADILKELSEKPSPEEIVEKIKAKSGKTSPTTKETADNVESPWDGQKPAF